MKSNVQEEQGGCMRRLIVAPDRLRAKRMNIHEKPGNAGRAMVFAAIIATLVGVFLASPTPDLLTLVLGAAISMGTLLIFLVLTFVTIRKMDIHLSTWMAIGVGAVFGAAAVLLSTLTLRFISFFID